MKVLFFFSLLTSVLFADNLHWFHSYDKAIEASKKEDKPVMLFITMRGCHACDRMEKDVFTNTQVSKYLQNHFVLLQLGIKNRRIPKKYQAYVTPTFEFIGSDGERIVPSVHGGKKVWKFLETLEDVVDELHQ